MENRVAGQLWALLDSRPLKALLWLTLCIEAGCAIWIARPWAFGDNVHYLTLSDAIANAQYGIVDQGRFEPDAIRPPGYPILLWFLRHVLGLPIVGVIVLQAAAYLGSLLLIGRMLDRAGYSSSLLLILAVIYPFPLMYSVSIAAEAWTMLTITAATVLLMSRSPPPSAYLAAGLLTGIAASFRSDLLFVPLVLGGYIFFQEQKARGDKSQKLARLATVVMAAAVVLLPYVIWNQSNFGRRLPTPVASAVGTSVYLATWQEKLPNEDLTAFYDGVVTPRARSAGLADEVKELNAGLGVPTYFAPWVPGNYPTNFARVEIQHRAADLAWKRIQSDPQPYAFHVVKNIWRLWLTGNYPSGLPSFAILLLKLSSVIILMGGMAGIFLSIFRPDDWPISTAPAVVIACVLGVHVWLHTEARYTASVRPLLLMLAAAAFYWMGRRIVRPTQDKSDMESRSGHAPQNLAR